MPPEQVPPRRRRIAGERTRRPDEVPAGEPPADSAAAPRVPPPSAAPRPTAPPPPPGGAATDGPAGTGARDASLSVLGIVVLGVLAVLTALAVVLAARYWDEARDQEAVDSARDQAASAAQDAAGPVLSIDRTDIEGSSEAAKSFMTDGYADDYQESVDQLIGGAAEQTGRSITASVKAVAVVPCGDACSADRVDVLVFVDQVTRSPTEPRPSRTLNRAVFTMERVDGEWLVDDLTGF